MYLSKFSSPTARPSLKPIAAMISKSCKLLNIIGVSDDFFLGCSPKNYFPICFFGMLCLGYHLYRKKHLRQKKNQELSLYNLVMINVFHFWFPLFNVASVRLV
jgi:hypothetical protein